MKQLSIMLKPASSACNLRCKYCFYADLAGKRDTFSFGRMDMQTVDRILPNVFGGLEPGDRVTIAFQGGEPTLVGLDWYRQFVEKTEKARNGHPVEYALQTNGTLLDDAWCEFLREHGFLVGLSIDGTPKTHNACRVDIDGAGTYNRVLQTLHLLKKHQVEFNVLCTLTAQVARHPQQIWNWIRENDLRFVQFTPCMDELGKLGASPYALTPERFASFYTQLFPMWLREFQQDNYYSIKLFDDIVNLLAYGVPTACGIDGQCRPQVIVESDGSVYPCDFYCLDEYRTGNLQETPLEELQKAPQVRAFLTRPRERTELCNSCPYLRICGGGCCHRMQNQVCWVPGGKSCGYRSFLDSSLNTFLQIAAQQRAMQRRG